MAWAHAALGHLEPGFQHLVPRPYFFVLLWSLTQPPFQRSYCSEQAWQSLTARKSSTM
jgi:hypothetical protein